MNLLRLHDELVLLVGPWAFHDRRVELVVPSLSDLFSSSVLEK